MDMNCTGQSKLLSEGLLRLVISRKHHSGLFGSQVEGRIKRVQEAIRWGHPKATE